MFGKRGRPSEDGFVRRREIYAAVAPLIAQFGSKGLTMRQASGAAHMSVAGIYHYFRSKDELVLFGVSPEALQRSCAEFHSHYGHLAQTNPEGFLTIALDSLVALVSFSRPALVAAIELGAATALEAIEVGVEFTLDEVVRPLRAVRPDMTDADMDVLQRLLRRILFGAMLDRKASPAQLREELWSIAQTRLLPHREPSALNSS